MAQNLNEALLKLELEVVGADAIKAAARAVEDYAEAAKKIQPSRIETVIGVVDLSPPGYKKAAANIKELSEVVKQASAAIKTNLLSARQDVRLFFDELRDLRGTTERSSTGEYSVAFSPTGQSLVPNRILSRSIGPVRRQVIGAVTSQMGLLPADVDSISNSDRLYRAAYTASNATNRMGSRDSVAALEAENRALRATRDVAGLAPEF